MALHQTTGNWRLGLMLALMTVVLWGLVPVALAIVLTGTDIYTVNWFRFTVSFILLGTYLGARQQLPSLDRLRTISPWLMGCTIAGLAANYYYFVRGLQATSPSHAEVLIQIAPVCLGIGGLVIFKERFTRSQWVGLGILIAGFIGFFAEQLRVLTGDSSQYIWGSWMLVIAAIAWAIYALAQKQLLNKLASAQIMWIIYGACGLFFAGFSAPTTLLNLNLLQWAMLAFCGFNTIIAYGAFAESLEHWEASRVSAVLALAPVFTIFAMKGIDYLMPNLVKAEQITGWGLVGAILVVVGSMAIALGQRKLN
jgi:drug/metabolite transporter (DMT)-like permease